AGIRPWLFLFKVNPAARLRLGLAFRHIGLRDVGGDVFVFVRIRGKLQRYEPAAARLLRKIVFAGVVRIVMKLVAVRRELQSLYWASFGGGLFVAKVPATCNSGASLRLAIRLSFQIANKEWGGTSRCSDLLSLFSTHTAVSFGAVVV